MTEPARSTFRLCRRYTYYVQYYYGPESARIAKDANFPADDWREFIHLWETFSKIVPSGVRCQYDPQITAIRRDATPMFW